MISNMLKLLHIFSERRYVHAVNRLLNPLRVCQGPFFYSDHLVYHKLPLSQRSAHGFLTILVNHRA